MHHFVCGFCLWALSASICAWLAGCGSTEARTRTLAEEEVAGGHGPALAAIARDLLGTPYRPGGTTLRGLDCSGLVHYAYARLGIAVPRSTRDLYRNAWPVDLAKLREGDLLFFHISRRKVSHVGIYESDGRFIHVAYRRKRVAYSQLSNPYWRGRLVAAGRFF
jgi:murein DD-endopeptidase